MLSSLLFVMQTYDIHPDIIHYVIAQLLHYVACEVFNRMMSNKKMLSRSKALQTRLNLSILEDWIRLNHLPTKLSDQFAPLVQLLQLLQVLSLQEDDSFLRLRYTFTNLARHPIDFLWNIHPALAISEHTRLAIPADRGITDPWRETRFEGNAAFTWPYAVDRAGQKVDLRRVDPPGAGVADMHYLVEVQDGWYAVTDQAAGVGFALAFPRAIFPHVWLFRALGGWRGLYTLILEASTGYPYDLEVARQRGPCGHLEPGASIEAEVLAIAYSGISDVANVRPDGRVIPKA